MQQLLRYLFVFLLLANNGDILAQGKKPSFELITGFNGITIGKINAIAQDKNGYLWLSDQSNRCLLRFDGNRLTRYFNNPQDANSLGGYYPESIFIDSAGNLWISFWGMGLDKFDPNTNTFTHYRHKKDDPNSLANDTVAAVVVDKEGKIWVGTNSGLDLLDEKTGRFKHYQHDPANPKSLSWNKVRSVMVDRKGDLWVGTGLIWVDSSRGGLNRFNPATDDFTRFVHNPADPNSLSQNSVRCIFEDSYGNFWVGTGGDGIQTLDRNTGKFTRYPYDPQKPNLLSRSKPRSLFDNITFIIEDAARHIWFGTYAGGLVRYDPATKQVQRFDPMGRNNIVDSTAWAAKALADGTVWIGTELNNFFKTDVLQNKIPFNYMPDANCAGSLMEDNQLWFCTKFGLVRKEYATGSTKTYPVDRKKRGGLGGEPYWVIKDRDGVIWTATTTGLYRLNESSETFELFILDSTAKQQPYVFNVYEDSGQRLWTFGFDQGLYLINRERNRVQQFVHHPSLPSINANTPSMLTEYGDQEYMISLAFNGGLNKYDLKTDTWSKYQVGLSCIYIGKDRKGVFWAGTDAGLFRYDPASDQFMQLANDGRINFQDVVNSMTIDEASNIWVGSRKTIFRVSANRDAITEFGEYFITPDAGDFQHNTANSRGGNIYMGCSNGYYFFNPDSLGLSQLKSMIHLSGFWLDNKRLPVSPDGPIKKPLNIINDITLKYDQNTFSFTASVINFKYPATTVQYQLEPYDGIWRSAQSEERIQYYNLPSGKYFLKVRTPNPDGSWVMREIKIIIDPPWWRSTLAKLIYAFLVLLVIFGLDRFQRKRIREQERFKASQRELEQAREIEKAYHQLKNTQAQLVQSEKMASLGELTAGIAHEIQNPLNFVTNFSEVNTELIADLRATLDEQGEGIKKREDAEEIMKALEENETKILFHGKRADAIVKSMLQHSRATAGLKEPTDLNALADEYLRLAYHGLRAKNKSFQSEFQFTPDPAIGKVNVVPQDFGRVLLNLINNAFYAVQDRAASGEANYQPLVEVKTALVGNKILLTVKDNGNGIPEAIRQKIFQPFFTTKPTGQGTGLGLSLSYDIVKAHGGELQLHSKEGEGSEFTISLPVNG